MLSVIWRETALDDLQQIVDFISDSNFDAAWRLHALIWEASERLTHFPHMHRVGRRPGTREAVVHPNYILVYRVGSTSIDILNVVHARRNYP